MNKSKGNHTHPELRPGEEYIGNVPCGDPYTTYDQWTNHRLGSQPLDMDRKPLNPEKSRPLFGYPGKVWAWVNFLDVGEMPPDEFKEALANPLGEGIFPSADDYIFQ
jgi:hypothetical protein